MNNDTRRWYEESYLKDGPNAQRSYPNEELVRFLKRTQLPQGARVLELGAGVGGNLWMIAREGHLAVGIDIVVDSVRLSQRTVRDYGLEAVGAAADMKTLPFRSSTFDAVVDVFSGYSMPESDFSLVLSEVQRVLRPGGRYFCFTPAQSSDVFLSSPPEVKIDPSTLKGMTDGSAPYHANNYPFRFEDPDLFSRKLEAVGLTVSDLELVGRTYGQRRARFDFLVASATNVPRA